MTKRRKPSRHTNVETEVALIGELRASLADLRLTVAATKELAESNRALLEHTLASVKQIASIEGSIIRVFKPMQETVDLHGMEIGTLKSRLDKLELDVGVLMIPAGEVPLC